MAAMDTNTTRPVRLPENLDPIDPRTERLLSLVKSQKVEGVDDSQRSRVWYERRKHLITASDVGAVLGTNPYMSRVEILRRKIDEVCGTELSLKSSHPISDYAQKAINWGNDHEEHAKMMYAKRYNKTIFDLPCIIHPRHRFIGASPDGVVAETGALIEIKCPYKRKPCNGYIPRQYYDQMQLQLEVCGLDVCYYVEWTPTGGEWEDNYELLLVQKVIRDPQWFITNMPIIDRFWIDVLFYRNHVDYAVEHLKRVPKPKRVIIKDSSAPSHHLPTKSATCSALQTLLTSQEPAAQRVTKNTDIATVVTTTNTTKHTKQKENRRPRSDTTRSLDQDKSTKTNKQKRYNQDKPRRTYLSTPVINQATRGLQKSASVTSESTSYTTTSGCSTTTQMSGGGCDGEVDQVDGGIFSFEL
jgi:putative phage-type endonuclease